MREAAGRGARAGLLAAAGRGARAVLLAVLLAACVAGAAFAAPDIAFTPVSDRAELEAIARNPAGSYRLTADIDLSGTDWTPFAFSGELDGAGFAVRGLRVTATGAGAASAVDGNGKGYKAAFAGLFSRLDGARVHDLALSGARVTVSAAGSCFAALLAGRAEDADIARCAVDGAVIVTAGGDIGGAGGLVGYMDGGTLADCAVRATAVFADSAPKRPCEQFLGGLYACGWGDALRCGVTLDGFATVYGYTHNGGLIGMYRVTPKSNRHAGTVSGCTVSARIAFFERGPSRRAYCEPLIGEVLNKRLTVSDNVVAAFEKREAAEGDLPLYPETASGADGAV